MFLLYLESHFKNKLYSRECKAGSLSKLATVTLDRRGRDAKGKGKGRESFFLLS